MLLHELDEDKNPARHYVLGNEYIGLDNNYYLTDEQGSVRYVLDAVGNVQNDYWYDAFGQCIAGQENIPNRLRYTAQIEDDLTGLYYLRARYYNTGIGRFTQEDVIYNDRLNLYAYCSSNPVMYADPSGYACEPKEWAENSKTSYGKSSGKYDTTADFLTNIENRNGKFYIDKATIDKIGQVEARGEDFSLLNKRIMSSCASTEGGTFVVYKYSDELGTKYLIHEVTDARGYIIHRDFDAVRISSGQLINKGH